MPRRIAATAASLTAAITLTACGTTATPAPPRRPNPPRASPLTLGKNSPALGPIERRLRAAGYPIYPISPDDPLHEAAFSTQVDWTTRRAFQLYVIGFPTRHAARAYYTRWHASAKRYAATFAIELHGRTVYIGSTIHELYGGRVEPGTLPHPDFHAIVTVADGRPRPTTRRV
jgi:hypothetical protein